MATGMVTFKTDRDADTYQARLDTKDKLNYHGKYLIDVVIASAATAGVPIAATLTPGAEAPGDLLESGDDFNFSLKDEARNIFKEAGSGTVD